MFAERDGDEVCLQCGHRISTPMLGWDEIAWEAENQKDRRRQPRHGNKGKEWL